MWCGSGAALLWYNLLPDGNADVKSLHANLPVLEVPPSSPLPLTPPRTAAYHDLTSFALVPPPQGEKWVLNFWVWDPVKHPVRPTGHDRLMQGRKHYVREEQTREEIDLQMRELEGKRMEESRKEKREMEKEMAIKDELEYGEREGYQPLADWANPAKPGADPDL